MECHFLELGYKLVSWLIVEIKLLGDFIESVPQLKMSAVVLPSLFPITPISALKLNYFLDSH